MAPCKILTSPSLLLQASVALQPSFEILPQTPHSLTPGSPRLASQLPGDRTLCSPGAHISWLPNTPAPGAVPLADLLTGFPGNSSPRTERLPPCGAWLHGPLAFLDGQGCSHWVSGGSGLAYLHRGRCWTWSGFRSTPPSPVLVPTEWRHHGRPEGGGLGNGKWS